jgi:acyl carrier protein
MEVEDHFGISLGDDEAAQIRTVGDLVAIIRARAVAGEQEYCPTSSAFYSLRKQVREIAGDHDLRIRPHDEVAATLSPRLRRQLWRRLRELLKTEPRALHLPPRLRSALVVAGFCLVSAALTTAAIDVEIVPLALFCAAVLGCGLLMACSAFREVPPQGWTTWGELARRIAGISAIKSGRNLTDDDVVLEELRPIIAEQLGVDAERISLSTRFVEDLGMG